MSIATVLCHGAQISLVALYFDKCFNTNATNSISKIHPSPNVTLFHIFQDQKCKIFEVSN